MKTYCIFAAVALLISTAAFADPPGSGGSTGNGCTENCGGGSGGQGGNGGNGGSGGASTSTSTAVTGATATAGGSTASVSGAGGNASTGSVSNSVSTGNVRSLSLGAAAVGSPAAETCVAYLAIGFGLITAPTQLESCVAMQQALLLEHFGLRDAAIARLCQLKEIAATGICPTQPKKETVSSLTNQE